MLGRGQVLTIDPVERAGRPQHPRIHYLRGHSTDREVLARVARAIAGARAVLVLLDSDHSYANVLAELRAYHGFVTPGSYCVVEDGNVGGHPVAREFGAGPLEAVRAFLARDRRVRGRPRAREVLPDVQPERISAPRAVTLRRGISQQGVDSRPPSGR